MDYPTVVFGEICGQESAIENKTCPHCAAAKLEAEQAKIDGLREIIKVVYLRTNDRYIEHITAVALGHKVGCAFMSVDCSPCDCGGVK